MMLECYHNYCTLLQSTEKYRQLPVDYGEHYLDFSSNDYLGLSYNSELIKAAIDASYHYGLGATGSRLLSGNKQIFLDLEQQIAQDKNTESALIFNSGFQANSSVLASLLETSVLIKTPIVFFDYLNHASLYQAISLNKVELKRYKHNNLGHLEYLLKKYQTINRPKFIVAETIFGMDGDLLFINGILELAKKYNALLYLDEAHATGLLGNYGYGLSTTVDLSTVPHVVMGTFSKSLGCCGAYIATNNIIKNYIINKTPGFIYSTALSPVIIGANLRSWQLIKSLNYARINLFKQAKYLRHALIDLGFNIGKSETHIIPIILGNEKLVLQARDFLLKNNIIVSAIRPPSVPPNTARLRIALRADHSKADIINLITVLKSLCKLL